jgi:hypothetical protein
MKARRKNKGELTLFVSLSFAKEREKACSGSFLGLVQAINIREAPHSPLSFAKERGRG